MGLIVRNARLALESFRLEATFEAHNRITALFGPSGAGKTSLLDILAGLRNPQTAWIQLGPDVLTDTDRAVCVPARRRGIGYVPQDLALFPHLSVRQNLLYGHKPSAYQGFSLAQVLDVLEIGGLLNRRVTETSGGEKQRVALARALLSSPRLLLLDEPLANLDLPLKMKILPYLSRVRDTFQIPILYVTHDRFETLSLADEMVVLVGGRVLQAGSVKEVFSRPADLTVAGIVTMQTIQPGRIVQRKEGLVVVEVGSARLSAMDADVPIRAVQVHVCIRAEDVILVKGPDAPSSARNHLPGHVTSVAPEGGLTRIEIDCGFPLVALVTNQAREELLLHPGANVLALVKAPHVHLIPR